MLERTIHFARGICHHLQKCVKTLSVEFQVNVVAIVALLLFCIFGFGSLVTPSEFSRIRTRDHPNISPDSSPDIRPTNSCSELTDIWASCLAALQLAATAAPQQIRHTHAHTLISLNCPNTTQRILVGFLKYYVKQRCEPSSKRRPPLPSANRPLMRLQGCKCLVNASNGYYFKIP